MRRTRTLPFQEVTEVDTRRIQVVVQENITIETFAQRLDEKIARYAPPAHASAPTPPAPVPVPTPPTTPTPIPTPNTGPSLISKGSRWKRFSLEIN